VRIETALQQVLDQFDADFYIAADHIRITTPAIKELVTGPIRLLRDLKNSDEAREELQLERRIVVRHSPTITATFKDMPLAEAIKSVSARSGRSVVLASDVGDKAKANISVSFANVPFESAVSGLADAAGLRAFRSGALVVVVSAERAKTIEGPFEQQGNGGGCCSFASGWTVKLEELESLARLFPTKPAEADVRRKELEEKVRKLTEELERAKTKN
jgi:hypothetical protein